MRAILVAMVVIAACKSEPTAPAASGSPSALAQARQVFDTRCSVCHGATGRGDGPAAGSLNPRPRNYADATWQAQVTDDQLKSVIVRGGPANGKSAMMPPNPDLANKPEVVDALVQLIRGFKR